MSAARQPSLFGHEAPGFDARVRGVHRRTLDHGAWVDHLDGWLTGHEAAFASFVEEVTWVSERRRMYDRMVEVPRLMGRCPSSGTAGALLRRLSLALSMRYATALSSIALAWYRDGGDSVAMHGDRVRHARDDALVAIVSVGAPRRFVLKPTAGGAGCSYSLGWGDLLVMGGSCQRTWQHGVPKVASAGARISIMFREVDNGRG